MPAAGTRDAKCGRAARRPIRNCQGCTAPPPPVGRAASLPKCSRGYGCPSPRRRFRLRVATAGEASVSGGDSGDGDTTPAHGVAAGGFVAGAEAVTAFRNPIARDRLFTLRQRVVG